MLIISLIYRSFPFLLVVSSPSASSSGCCTRSNKTGLYALYVHGHGQNHRQAIQPDETALAADQEARPALRELDGTINAPDDHQRQTNPHGDGDALHFRRSLDLCARRPDDAGENESKDEDGDELEGDTPDHGVGAGLGIPGGVFVESG